MSDFTREETRNVNIPFDGFYCSLYSSEIDSHEENEGEYYAQESEWSGKGLEVSDFCEAMFWACDYGALHESIAEKYVQAFSEEFEEQTGLALPLAFEAMTSPREYNFQTDRIFADIPESTLEKLFQESAKEGHKTLASVIAERFTSYDGFHSFYSNAIDDWLEKPFSEWDHNELGTLIIALLKIADPTDVNDFRLAVYYRVIDCDGIYNEYSKALDYEKFENELKERIEALEEA